MKSFLLALALGVVGVALFIATAGLAKWAGFPGSPFLIPWRLASDCVGLLWSALLLQALSLLATPILFLRQRFNPTPQPEGSDGLSILSFTAPGVGLLGALYGGWIIYFAMVRTHTVSFLVIAPSVAELLSILSFGFLAGGFAAVANALLIRRARKG